MRRERCSPGGLISAMDGINLRNAAAANDPLHARIAPVTMALSGIEAIKGALCIGSYAMGTFDEQSDIDLYVLCQPDIITPETRRRAFEMIDGVTELRIDHQCPAWDNQWCPAGDIFRLYGSLIDVGWNTIDWLRMVIQKVSEEAATSFSELRFRADTMLGLLANSVILLDPEGVLQRMKSELYPYPPRLKQALLRGSLPSLKGSLGDMMNYVARGIGNSAFHFHLERSLEALRTIVFALNERYDPADKRVEQAYVTMSKLPRDFLARYSKILETPLTDRGRRELVSEIEMLTKEFEIMIDAEVNQPICADLAGPGAGRQHGRVQS
ncbi:MAG: nucleotidyltransferase domain-containing protein [Armatimonadota bacterium]